MSQKSHGRRLSCLGFALSILLVGFHSRAEEPPPQTNKSCFTYEDYLIVPFVAHVLTASDLADINCSLTDADIKHIHGKVNRIWHKAGIHWSLGEIKHEPASGQSDFKKLKETLTVGNAVPLDAYRKLVPKTAQSQDGFHVYYIHSFSVNGVYLGDATAFVQETARLRPVPGGIDEPLPRVTAHELAHGLGLPHRQDRTNLLASGTTGTTFNEAEISRVRTVARTIAGVLTVSELRVAAEAAANSGDRARAARSWALLADIPGASTAKSAEQPPKSP